MDGIDFSSLFGSSSLDSGFSDFTSSMGSSQILGMDSNSSSLLGQGIGDLESSNPNPFGVGTGSIDGSMSGADAVSQFGSSAGSASGSLGSLGISALKAVGQAASGAIKGGSSSTGGGRGAGGMQTSEFPLTGHMRMYPQETPPAQKSKAAQSEDPRQVWMKWYSDMQNFAYKGK